MRWLLKCAVQAAAGVGLLDLAVQAVDGTKVAANAAGDPPCNVAEPEKLLPRRENAIGGLEAQTY